MLASGDAVAAGHAPGERGIARAARFGGGAHQQQRLFARGLQEARDLLVAAEATHHLRGVAMHLETVRGRRAAAGEALDDQEIRERILVVETETETAVLLRQGGEQQAFAMNVLEIRNREFAGAVVVRRARRDAISNQAIDAIDERLLCGCEESVHVVLSGVR